MIVLRAHRGINLNTHLAAGMRRCIADRDWITVYRLPVDASCPNDESV